MWNYVWCHRNSRNSGTQKRDLDVVKRLALLVDHAAADDPGERYGVKRRARDLAGLDLHLADYRIVQRRRIDFHVVFAGEQADGTEPSQIIGRGIGVKRGPVSMGLRRRHDPQIEFLHWLAGLRVLEQPVDVSSEGELEIERLDVAGDSGDRDVADDRPSATQ